MPIRKLAAAATTETDELMTCPWTAGSGKAVTARRAASMEQELQALDGSDEGEEFVPYCVMPHVERLLQVGLSPEYKSNVPFCHLSGRLCTATYVYSIQINNLCPCCTPTARPPDLDQAGTDCEQPLHGCCKWCSNGADHSAETVCNI